MLTNQGVLVLDVPEDSKAKLAGLKGTSRSSNGGVDIGDIIIGIDSFDISSETDLFKALEGHKGINV